MLKTAAAALRGYRIMRVLFKIRRLKRPWVADSTADMKMEFVGSVSVVKCIVPLDVVIVNGISSSGKRRREPT